MLLTNMVLNPKLAMFDSMALTALTSAGSALLPSLTSAMEAAWTNTCNLSSMSRMMCAVSFPS